MENELFIKSDYNDIIIGEVIDMLYQGEFKLFNIGCPDDLIIEFTKLRIQCRLYQFNNTKKEEGGDGTLL